MAATPTLEQLRRQVEQAIYQHHQRLCHEIQLDFAQQERALSAAADGPVDFSPSEGAIPRERPVCVPSVEGPRGVSCEDTRAEDTQEVGGRSCEQSRRPSSVSFSEPIDRKKQEAGEQHEEQQDSPKQPHRLASRTGTLSVVINTDIDPDTPSNNDMPERLKSSQAPMRQYSFAQSSGASGGQGSGAVTGTKSTAATMGSHHARHYVDGPWFSSLVTAIIMANVLFIGLQVELDTANNEQSPTIFGISVAFAIAFALEVALRLQAYRQHFFFGSRDVLWNIFDVVLTTIAIAECVMQGMRFTTETSGGLMNSFGALRTIRIVRILHIIRRKALFKPLRLLISAMVVATRSCMSLLLLLTLVIYTFSLFFTQACSNWVQNASLNDPQRETVLSYYGTLLKSMYTLYLSMSGGVNWAEPANAIGYIDPWYEAAFSGFMCFGFFIFLNVVTGVFCQIASESAAKDKEEQLTTLMRAKKLHMAELLKIFKELDDFGPDSPPGMFTLSELQLFLQDPRVQASFEHLDIKLTDVWTLSQVFGDGDLINCEEFLEGCRRMKGPAQAADVQIMIHELHTLYARNETLLQCVLKLERYVRSTLPPAILGSSTQTWQHGAARLSGKRPSANRLR